MAELPADVLDQLRDKLAAAASLAEPTERLLEVVATIDEALADIDVRPVVVGGLAMAHWSDRAFVTGDIDAVVPHRATPDSRLVALGFERHGRQWKLPGYPVIFERRAEEEGLSDALRALRALGARIEAGEVVENVELAHIARQLERQSYPEQDDV